MVDSPVRVEPLVVLVVDSPVRVEPLVVPVVVSPARVVRVRRSPNRSLERLNMRLTISWQR